MASRSQTLGLGWCKQVCCDSSCGVQRTCWRSGLPQGTDFAPNLEDGTLQREPKLQFVALEAGGGNPPRS
eukprot:511149-Pyramimonas_sp.AAC.1